MGRLGFVKGEVVGSGVEDDSGGGLEERYSFASAERRGTSFCSVWRVPAKV